MNLRQLEYFLRVTEAGSFTKAAARLRVAQPALSRQIRGLEVQLRQTLLVRNGRGVATTEAGKRLLAHARGILHQIARAREDLERLRGMPVGRVAIGMPPSIAKLLTVPLVSEFRKRYPGANLSISVGLSADLQERLRLGEIDVALLYDPMPTATAELVPYLKDDLCLVGPAARSTDAGPVQARQIPNYPLIIPSRPNTLRSQFENRLAALGIKPSIAFEVDGVETTLGLVSSGQGYAILTVHALRASGNTRAFTARPIVRPRLQTQLVLAIASQRPTSPIQESVVGLIKRIGMRVLAGRPESTRGGRAARR